VGICDHWNSNGSSIMATEDTDLFKVGSFIKSEISTILDSSTETNQELLDLINLRATTVSLENVEVRVEALETEIDGGTYS